MCARNGFLSGTQATFVPFIPHRDKDRGRTVWLSWFDTVASVCFSYVHLQWMLLLKQGRARLPYYLARNSSSVVPVEHQSLYHVPGINVILF